MPEKTLTAEQMREIFKDARRDVATWPEWKRDFSIIAMTSTTCEEAPDGK